MLAKIELAMSDKVAREVIDIISKNSGLPKSIKSKIFVFEMQETIDVNTLKGESEVEPEEEIPVAPKFVTKRNRLIPLQKRTLYNLEQYYDKHHEVQCAMNEIYNVKKKLEKIILNFISTKIEWVPLTSVKVEKDREVSVIEFLENLEDDDDVQNVFSNVNFGNN